MITALLAALLWVLPLSPGPPPRVVVLQATGQADQSGFVEALSIRLAGSGVVVPGAPLEGASLPERVEGAGAAARAAGALLAVWLERAPARGGGEDVVLYVVGEADGRAVVQVFRIPAGSPADTDRALALKVGGVVDELLAPAAQVVLAPSTPPPAPPTVAPVARARRQLVLGLDARAGSSPGDDGWEAGGALVVGARRDDFELHVALGLGSGDTWTAAAGTVHTNELTGGLGARWLGLGGALDLAVRADLGVRVVVAEGTSRAGGTGDDRVASGVVSAVLERRFRRGPIELLVGLGGEWTPRGQTFEINLLPVADLGHVRGFLNVSLMCLVQ